MNRAAAAPPAPHASATVGQAAPEERLGLPHPPHLPHRISASGAEGSAPGAVSASLAALAERWEARTAATQAGATGPQEAEPVAAPAPARMDLAAPVRPALAWWRLPYGAARGHALADARAERGACRICAGRRWWRRAGAAEEPTCEACHPSPPGLAVVVINAALAAEPKGD